MFRGGRGMTRVAVVFVAMKMHELHSEWLMREVVSQPLYVLNVAVMSFARNSGISSGVVMKVARLGFVFHAAAMTLPAFRVHQWTVRLHGHE